MKANRRQILKWTPPAIGAVVLPRHAQATTFSCSEPLLIVSSAPKCEISDVGDINGSAVLTLLSPDLLIPIEVISIHHDAVDPNEIRVSDEVGTITSNQGIDIEWRGPSAEFTPCLPETNVRFVVRYVECFGEIASTFSFDLLSVLT